MVNAESRSFRVLVVSDDRKMLRRMSKDTAASKLTPQMVSEKILEVVGRAKKPLRVPMDRAKQLTRIKRFAPQGMLDKMIAGLVGLGPGKA